MGNFDVVSKANGIAVTPAGALVGYRVHSFLNETNSMPALAHHLADARAAHVRSTTLSLRASGTPSRTS
jgi:hypothetical protein